MSVAPITWISEYVEDGVVMFRIGTRGASVIAEWVGLALLTATIDGGESQLTFAADASASDRTKIERGSAMLLLRHLQGKLALHGAAVVRDGHAVVLLGRSGQGKSTLSAALCDAGFELLADDAVALEPDETGGWRVLPSEADHWLDASGTGKCPVRARAVADAPARVVALVDLVTDTAATGVTLCLSKGIAAIAAVVPQAVRFVLDDDARNRRELETLASLVSAVSTYELRRPRDLALLPGCVGALESLLRKSDD